MRIAIVCAAALSIVPMTASPQDKNAGRDLAASCAMCHGTNGRGAVGYEPLAGMAKQDLVRKVSVFRAGAKPATVMHQIAKGYTYQQIQLIAGSTAGTQPLSASRPRSCSTPTLPASRLRSSR